MRLTNFQKNALTVAAVGGLVYLGIRRALPKAGAAINPVNPENVVNQGAEYFVQALNPQYHATTGRPLTIGDRIYAFFNPDDARKIGLIQ